MKRSCGDGKVGRNNYKNGLLQWFFADCGLITFVTGFLYTIPVQYTRSAETYKSLNLLIFLRATGRNATRETKPSAVAIIQFDPAYSQY